MKGDAALDRNRTREQIKKEVRRILEEAVRIDIAEDQEYGPEHRETGRKKRGRRPTPPEEV